MSLLSQITFQEKLSYWKRILTVYLLPGKNPLSFWYETPEVNLRAFQDEIGEYYMAFQGKAEYSGPFDENGIPLLDYRGDIGLQYNPIAISQFGLAHFNRYKRFGHSDSKETFLRVANWMVHSLEENEKGVPVWKHHFDWPYRERLIAPWYSGLAQGQGVSLLIRAAIETGETQYDSAIHSAFESFTLDTEKGGVMVRDKEGDLWIEEYIVNPPSHILNGFIWALWGVFDYCKWSGSSDSKIIFQECERTISKNLSRYDTGSWSMYELSDSNPPMLTSPYYHQLHVTQLRILHRMTSNTGFLDMANRWERFLRNPFYRGYALARKAWFKIRYY